MHGLEAVPHIGERATDDHAHGVIKIGLPKLVLDVDRNDFPALVGTQIRHRVSLQKKRAILPRSPVDTDLFGRLRADKLTTARRLRRV